MFPGLWKVSVVCPVYKNVGEHLTPLKYYSISLSLLILSSTRLSIMLTETTFWVTKSIVFNPLGSLLMSWLSFSETLDNKFIMREVVLDISKVFDKVWQRWLLHKLTSYGISRRDFVIIKSPSYWVGSWSSSLMAGPVSLINAGVPKALSSVLPSFYFILTICLRFSDYE